MPKASNTQTSSQSQQYQDMGKSGARFKGILESVSGEAESRREVFRGTSLALRQDTKFGRAIKINFGSEQVNSWDSDHTKNLMRGSAAILRNFATQLEAKLSKEDFDMTPEDALFLLGEINRFGESMTTLAKQHAQDKDQSL